MVSQSETDTLSDWYILGTRNYELDNHLGNVLSVISDKKIGVTSDGSTVDYYRAEVLSQKDYYPFGMEEPYRQYSIGNGYRYGFNGKEKDNEMAGIGNHLDFMFRDYDPRIGRFWRNDPLEKQFPWIAPYAYAMNRPINGIDIEGLEYLRADKARVEFRYGRLQLKVENFTIFDRNTWKRANDDPKNWSPGVIGIDPTVANLQIIAPKPQMPELRDIPSEYLPAFVTGQTETGIQSQAYNRAGVREIKRDGPIVNIPAGKGGIAKGAVFIDAINFSLEQFMTWAWVYDENKINAHIKIAQKVANNMTEALRQGLVPKKYQNKNDLVNIMNVVLQGVNNTDNRDIFDIGMKIYNTLNPKLETVTIPSSLDNYPSKTIIIPSLKPENKQHN